jgi:hypothetical protein
VSEARTEAAFFAQATNAAVERLRDGLLPGLAVYLSAREYGVDQSRLARAVAGRRRKRRVRVFCEPPANAWWLR